MISTAAPPPSLTPRVASFGGDPAFGSWLVQHKDAMFRWALNHAGNPLNTPNPLARRAFAESSVAVQKRQGATRYVAWLFGAMLLAAHRRASEGGIGESMLGGLPPELRGALRLVGRGELSPIEGWGLLQQPTSEVRYRLLRARLDGGLRPSHHQ